MEIITDTNAVSAFFEGTEAVVAKMTASEALYLPVIVLGEYGFGLRGSRRRVEWEAQLLAFARACSVLPVLESTAIHYAAIRDELKTAGTPIPENDIWIASLAREHRLPLLSNDRHFDFVSNLQRISWERREA